MKGEGCNVCGAPTVIDYGIGAGAGAGAALIVHSSELIPTNCKQSLRYKRLHCSPSCFQVSFSFFFFFF